MIISVINYIFGIWDLIYKALFYPEIHINNRMTLSG